MEILELTDLFPYYNLRDSTIKNTVFFKVSRKYTEIKSSEENTGLYWRPWDKIAPGLYLGKIPSVGNSNYSVKNQHEQIIQFVDKKEEGKRPLGLVVSAVDYFELSDPSVVPPESWEEKGVKHILLPVSDFTSNISNESIVATVKAMRECVEDGKAVYVHCKAGRSRSAMLETIYLAVYGDGQDKDFSSDVDAIEKFLIQQRPQVSLNKDQREKAKVVISEMKKAQLDECKRVFVTEHPLQLEEDENSLPLNYVSHLQKSLKSYLGSLQLKNEIIQFTSFKMLAIYACRNQNWSYTSSVTNDVKAFFKSIYDATNEIWYLYLVNKAGPMQKLIDEPAQLYTSSLGGWLGGYNASTYTKECEKLRDHFIDELHQHLAKTFHCTVEEIKAAGVELGNGVKNILTDEEVQTETEVTAAVNGPLGMAKL